MSFNSGALTYALSSALLLFLCLLLVTVWRGRVKGFLFFTACAFSAAWSLMCAYSAQYGYSLNSSVILIELIKYVIWAAFLIQLLHSINGTLDHQNLRLTVRSALLIPILLLAFTLYSRFLPHSSGWLNYDVQIFGHVLIALIGLSLIEQIFRSIKSEQLWAVKFLCFGLGAMYGFDFVLYSDALLFARINVDLWDARGIINSIGVCLIAVAISRNPQVSTAVKISRSAMFYTTVFVAAGGYLLLMSAGGFYLRTFGGDWGAVVAFSFLFCAFLFLLLLVFSGSIRARIRVFIDKHFLDYKYDYREQWLGLIRDLSTDSSSQSLEERSLRAIIEMMDSTGGSLWVKSSRNVYSFAATFGGGMDGVSEKANSSLVAFLEKWQWVINLDEFKSEPDLYRELTLPKWLSSFGNAWLVVPLMLQSKLYGFVVILRPRAEKEFNWEDIDLLKTAGRQIAVHLAQEHSALALAQAQQFEAFNRFSAYVVHDLKNLVSQLALVVKNAEKHKHNPAFMDDAILTVDNAVERMNRLLAQLRSGAVTENFVETLDMAKVVSTVVSDKSNNKPAPELVTMESNVLVLGNETRLVSVIGHMVQNAQDATSDDGRVSIELARKENYAELVISDSGCGMDDYFIKERLFKPFDTTKGLTGMGIGAHESRSYIEELGGKIDVDSEVGKGSIFTITLPFAEM